mmetsp:Transcript_15502/g.39829  ORF Transcript_15502/g.39829 Transcript_15502/m.39829 type:complete len:338 (-) Transcript_15502:1179-2192(-)
MWRSFSAKPCLSCASPSARPNGQLPRPKRQRPARLPKRRQRKLRSAPPGAPSSRPRPRMAMPAPRPSWRPYWLARRATSPLQPATPPRRLQRWSAPLTRRSLPAFPSLRRLMAPRRSRQPVAARKLPLIPRRRWLSTRASPATAATCARSWGTASSRWTARTLTSARAARPGRTRTGRATPLCSSSAPACGAAAAPAARPPLVAPRGATALREQAAPAGTAPALAACRPCRCTASTARLPGRIAAGLMPCRARTLTARTPTTRLPTTRRRPSSRARLGPLSTRRRPSIMRRLPCLWRTLPSLARGRSSPPARQPSPRPALCWTSPCRTAPSCSPLSS